MTVTAVLVGSALAWALAPALLRPQHRRVAVERLAVAERAMVDRRTARRVGAAVAALAIAMLSPAVAGLGAAALVARELWRRRPRTADVDDAAIAAFPDAVDLLAVVARAGLPATAAIGAVAERAPPPWRAAFHAVVSRTTRGDRLLDALDELPAACGATGASLRAVLRAATDDGADLPSGLDRLAADARDLRRRRAEEAARKVPVRLLLPLVACSLPAFALLSIVPIVAGALGSLDL